MGRSYDYFKTGATGAHSILGGKGLESVSEHELNHFWLSRAMNNQFIFNYGLQLLLALRQGQEPFMRANYFEQLGYGNEWNY